MVENIETEASVTVDQPHSCKIAINAKGQFSGEVKSYGVSLDEAMQSALRKAAELEKIIQEKNKLV